MAMTPFSQRAGGRREGPGFEVIKKVRSPGDKRAPVLELPNGMFVFTHFFELGEGMEWKGECGTGG